MRLSLLLFVSILTHSLSSGQPNTVNKIYFFTTQYDTLTFSSTNDEPIPGAIRISRCTLLETNLNQLLINYTTTSWLGIDFTKQPVYYKKVGGFSLHGRVSPLTQEEFNEKVNEKGPGIYRHYFLDKKLGLRLIEQKR